MKFSVLIVSVFLLASCNGSKNQSSKQKSESQDSFSEEISKYVMPKVGFTRSVPLNFRLEFMYENMTVNPNGNDNVLGDRPYYLEIDSDNAVQMHFYSRHDLTKVSYVDLGSNFEITKISNFDIKSLLKLRPVDLQDFYREFTYGKINVDSPEQDMLNKVFIIETQQSDDPYVSTMTQMFWIECDGGFKKTKDSYSCGDGKLKFNYKLLDYKLQKSV